MISQIESEIAETNKQILSNNFCSNCLHHKNEHSSYKCYGLNNNGGVWKSCSCKEFKSEFVIRFSVDEDEISIPTEKD